MTPPLALPDPPEVLTSGLDFPPESARKIAPFPIRRPAARKAPPVEDLALLLVVMGFVAWSVAFAYRLSG